MHLAYSDCTPVSNVDALACVNELMGQICVSTDLTKNVMRRTKSGLAYLGLTICDFFRGRSFPMMTIGLLHERAYTAI